MTVQYLRLEFIRHCPLGALCQQKAMCKCETTIFLGNVDSTYIGFRVVVVLFTIRRRVFSPITNSLRKQSLMSVKITAFKLPTSPITTQPYLWCIRDRCSFGYSSSSMHMTWMPPSLEVKKGDRVVPVRYMDRSKLWDAAKMHRYFT